MSFRKFFEAVPIKLAEQFRALSEPGQSDLDEAKRRAVLKLAVFGALIGAGAGLTAISLRNGDLSWLRDVAPVSASSNQDSTKP